MGQGGQKPQEETMPEIHSDVVAQVILLAREAEDSRSATARRELNAFSPG